MQSNRMAVQKQNITRLLIITNNKSSMKIWHFAKPLCHDTSNIHISDLISCVYIYCEVCLNAFVQCFCRVYLQKNYICNILSLLLSRYNGQETVPFKQLTKLASRSQSY